MEIATHKIKPYQQLKLFVCILLLAFSSNAIGQTPAEMYLSDAKAIAKRMKEVKSFHAKTEVTVKSNGLVLKRTSEIKKLGTKTWTKTEGIENAFTSSHIITVLDEQKLISYSKGIGKKNMDKHTSQDIIPVLDSVISKFDSITYQALSNGEKKYTLHSANQMFTKVVVVLYSNLKYKSMEYHYNQNLYKGQEAVKIKFTLWNESAVINEKIYELNNYILKSDNSYIPIDKYKGYQVIENTESLKK